MKKLHTESGISLNKLRKWSAVIFLLLSLFNLWPVAIVEAHNNSFEHPRQLLQVHRQNILHLSSDKEALKFHKQFMPPQLKLQQSVPPHQSSRDKLLPHHIPQGIQTAITTFWAALAGIGYTQEFRTALLSFSNTELPVMPDESQLQWFISKSGLEKFQDLINFQKTLSTWSNRKPLTIPLGDNNFLEFSSFLDRATSTDHNQTWITLFKNEGFKGIQDRLQEYWKDIDPQSEPQLVSEAFQESYFEHYIETRLLAIFHAHFLSQTIAVETHTYDVAWKSWEHIQQWQQQEQSKQTLGRLCGTWKWIIHNHQNHGDYKTTMTFTSPEDSSPPQVQPSVVHIHGDTVYLKWTFPQGFQEDSLLFSNRDARLEGTFTSSQGPYGSISAQRLSSCKQ